MEIPEKTIFEKLVIGSIGRVFGRQNAQAQTPAAQEQSQPLNIDPRIKKSSYIQIGNEEAISKFELPCYNNMDWQETHFKLHDNGLYMPTPRKFMTFLQTVIQAFNSKGKIQLFDAAGNPVTEKELEDIYLHLTKGHINVYTPGKNEGAWTWLDAVFSEENGIMKVLSEHRTATDSNGNKILKPGKTESLENCLMENCLSNLTFNNQGLPTQKSQDNSYVQGENIHFWHPRNKMVARFSVISSRAGLYCGRIPSDRYPSLGAFAIAQSG